MHKNGKELKYTSVSQGLQTKTKKHDCGAPPPQGEYWSGLSPSILSTNNKVTGVTTNMLHKENRKKRHTCQEEQGSQRYWSTNEGKSKLPAEMPSPGKHRNNMCPLSLEVHHPAYETLKIYATGGCPVKTGQNWTKEEIHAAVMRGPHKSVLSEESIAHFAAEEKEKWHKTNHVWYAIKRLKVISQQKLRFHQMRQSPTSQKHSYKYWTCHFH